jgi:sortase A
MGNKRGIILMAAGVLLLAAAVTLTSVNLLDERKAEMQSEKTAGVLHEQIPSYAIAKDIVRDDISRSLENMSDKTPIIEIQTVEIDHQDYIGVLDIPALRLSLPVMNTWSYPLLKLSPCLYSGSFLDNSMIIAGHNYQRHFGELHRLVNGDAVNFTDVTGVVYEYVVASIETLGKTDVKEMKSGNWDLTLFTCTQGGVSRVTVRCMLKSSM